MAEVKQDLMLRDIERLSDQLCRMEHLQDRALINEIRKRYGIRPEWDRNKPRYRMKGDD